MDENNVSSAIEDTPTISDTKPPSVQWTKSFKSTSTNLHRLHRFYAKRDFQRCKEIIDGSLADSAEILCEEHLLLRTKLAREEGSIQESVSWARRVLKNRPESARANLELGKGLYLLAETRHALTGFTTASVINQDDWKTHYWKALACYHASKPPKCVASAKEALLACSRLNASVDVLTFLARLLSEQNEVVAAVEAYKRGIEIEPENADLLYSLGMLYMKSGSETKAFALLGKCLSSEPNYVPGVLAIASILQTHGDYDVALSKYKPTIAKHDHSGALWNNIGCCYLGRGKLIAAVSCLLRANYLCPLDWKVAFNLALVYHALRQFATAFHFISAAFSIYPQNPLILVAMGVILTEMEDFTNARAAHKKALSLGPSSPVAKLNYIIFEYRRGNIDLAAERLRTMPELTGKKEIDELLEQLRSSMGVISTEGSK